MITVEEIRKRMRISHTALDEEIQDNIESCKADLARVGVDTGKDDKLLDKAYELYCKAQNNYQGRGEEFQKQYERLADALSVCASYRENSNV